MGVFGLEAVLTSLCVGILTFESLDLKNHSNSKKIYKYMYDGFFSNKLVNVQILYLKVSLILAKHAMTCKTVAKEVHTNMH